MENECRSKIKYKHSDLKMWEGSGCGDGARLVMVEEGEVIVGGFRIVVRGW